MKPGQAIKYHTADGDLFGWQLDSKKLSDGRSVAHIAYVDNSGTWSIVMCEQGTDHGKFEVVQK